MLRASWLRLDARGNLAHRLVTSTTNIISLDSRNDMKRGAHNVLLMLFMVGYCRLIHQPFRYIIPYLFE